MATTERAIKVTHTGGVGRAEFPALGTSAVVLTSDPGQVARAAVEVRQELAAIDAACSRFRPDSELEVANRSSGHTLAVGPLLAEAIEVALRAAQLTDGDVDPTVGEAMQVIGYDRDFADVPADGPRVINMIPVRGWTNVRFDPRWGSLRVPAGLKLDLGATAKALAADRSAARVHAELGGGVLVSLGGDIATAGESPWGGWKVRVTDWHAAGPSASGQTVTIRSGGLATSGTTARRWQRGGKEMHHIVDPSTGRPARTVWRTATVAAATCVDANTASTAAIVRGERSPVWLSSLGLPARLVRPDGSALMLNGWPEEVLAA
jgi:FAD:protein FMN transferase